MYEKRCVEIGVVAIVNDSVARLGKRNNEINTFAYAPTRLYLY
jgi:hypothetical protein